MTNKEKGLQYITSDIAKDMSCLFYPDFYSK